MHATNKINPALDFSTDRYKKDSLFIKFQCIQNKLPNMIKDDNEFSYVDKRSAEVDILLAIIAHNTM